MARPRKQTYTLDMYLKKIKDKKICNDADVQRKFAWKSEHINELIVTVLTDDYIPPIILGEEENSQLHIVDGGCRSAALMDFRYGNRKITSSIENPVIVYKKKKINENGNIVWEDAEFNVKNKTYDKLPEELQEKFAEYQIETVIHEACDSAKISKYIKRYNNHVAMNTDQKAFTYIDRFAGKIHKIVNGKFFIECKALTDNDRNKGVIERIVVESLMCSNHFNNWKTDAKESCKYLNNNATEKEFDDFTSNLNRLGEVITDDIKDIFNKKDSFIFLTLFNRFTKLGFDDSRFVDFLREFKNELRDSTKNKKRQLFDEIDKGTDKKRSTKDKQVVFDKLEMLENLMLDFLHVKQNDICPNSVEEFIAEYLDMDIDVIKEDMDIYNEDLDTLLENTVKFGSKLLNQENRPSLLTMVVYSYKEDMKLDDWLSQYAATNNTYFIDQKKNFLHMKNDFEQYIKKCA